MVAKVEFPIGKKLFHLVLNTGTWRCPTVVLELVQTTRNVNGTRHSVRKFQPGKRDHLFRFSTLSGNFPVGRTDETCSIYRLYVVGSQARIIDVANNDIVLLELNTHKTRNSVRYCRQ